MPPLMIRFSPPLDKNSFNTVLLHAPSFAMLTPELLMTNDPRRRLSKDQDLGIGTVVTVGVPTGFKKNQSLDITVPVYRRLRWG